MTLLLESLADKLGTTVEYLWCVLIKEAAISATINLMFVAFTIICIYIFTKVHINFVKTDKYIDDGGYGNLVVVIPMVVVFVVLLIMFMISLFAIGDVINGFLNPEYWALQQILQG